MTTRKEISLYAVCNKRGQYLGSFRAHSAAEAINKMIRADAATASTFRRSQPASLKTTELEAVKMDV